MVNQKKLRALANIKRLSMYRCNKEQSVAEHSFYTANIAFHLAIDIFLNLEQALSLCYHALLHDSTEAIIGDINHVVKMKMDENALFELEEMAEFEIGYHPPISQLTDMEKEILEFADVYELKMYLEEERRSGNSLLFKIEQESYGRLLKSKIPDENKKKWISELEEIIPLHIDESEVLRS